MEETLPLFDSLLKLRKQDKLYHLLLSACDEQQVLACKQPENKIRRIVRTVNSKLNNRGPRSSAIHLLPTLMSQCSDIIFLENSISWMIPCLKVASRIQSEEAYVALRMLLDFSRNFQELTKSIAGQVIPKLLETICKSQKSVAALQCLEILLHYYPGSCKNQMKNIQKFLILFVDTEDKVLVEYASRCICYLPQLSISKNDGSAWTEMLTELVATASSQMYLLFENVHEFIIPPALTELSIGYSLENVNKGSAVLTLSHVATRLINILTFIEGMLLGDVHLVKAVRADLLVALAYRALAVNCKMVSRGNTMEHIALVCVLPDVHVAVLNLLQTFVSCCPVGLLKYGPMFCKLVLQTLKWTKCSGEYGTEHPYRHLREATYKFLESWIQRAKAASCVELVAEELVPLMLRDIYQRKEAVTLQFQEKGKQVAKQQLPEGRHKLVDRRANAGPCEAALRTLTALIQASGSLLSHSQHMKLQEITVSLLMEIKRGSGPEDMPAPYSVSGCRQQLYELLLAVTLHPHPRWPPPTQFALSLFSSGQHDSSLKVAGFCTLALASTRQMVHPSQSSHQFPMTVEEMRASVGLTNLEPVRGVNLNEVDQQDEFGSGIISNCDASPEMAEGTKSHINKQPRLSLNNSLEQMAVSSSSNFKKPHKKLSRTSVSEVSVNGTVVSPETPNSDESRVRKRKFVEKSDNDKDHYSNRNRPYKRMQHLQFTIIEELNALSERKRARYGVQDWQVTEVTKKQKVESKENKVAEKSLKDSETPARTKHSLDSPTDVSGCKTGKLNASPCKLLDLPSNEPSYSDAVVNSNPSVIDETVEEQSDGDSVITENVQEGKVQEKVKEKESGLSVDRKIEEKEKEKHDASTASGVIGMVGKHKEQIEVLDEDRKGSGKEGRTDAVQEKSPPFVKAEAKRYYLRSEQVHTLGKADKTPSVESRSNSSKDKENSQERSPLKTTPEKSSQNPATSADKSLNHIPKSPYKSGKEDKLPKETNPVVELLLSSDSESEQSSNKNKGQASGAYHHITSNIGNHTSTPKQILATTKPEQNITTENLQTSIDSFTTEMLDHFSRLEESRATVKNSSLELAESDESTPMILRIDSDRESVEVLDVITDSKEIEELDKEKGDIFILTEEVTTSDDVPSISANNLKDSVTSDREMEEVSAGMEAIGDSPDVAVEEVPSSNHKESAEKKSATAASEDSNSESAEEEDILKTFVDVVSPKSA